MQASDWQHPFVDIFKRYNSFEASKSLKGSVSIDQDPVIARKVFRLTGSILSNNTVTIPDPTSELKIANLTGRYLYVEMLASPEKYFCLHLEMGIRDRQPGVRLTLTNMQKDYTLTGGNTLKIPFQPSRGNVWSIVCIDLTHHLESYGLFSKGAIKDYTGIHTLRGIQICSNLSVRGIYTSDNVYHWGSLPKEMGFRMVKDSKWEDHYDFLYLPSSLNPALLTRKVREADQTIKEFPSSIVEREQISTNKKDRSSLISPDHESKLKSAFLFSTEDYLSLSTAFAFSSLHNPDILFKAENLVYYSAGSNLVCRDIITGKQTFLQGHTDYIAAMDSEGDMIVTVQEGVKPSVKVWIDHKCINSFPCPYEKVQQIRLSHKRTLAMVGLDSYKRQAIMVFDISKIETNKEPELLAKQISDFNILTIKFSPADCDRLVSCGKENIRFWRIKNQHLPGSPVILNNHARNTIFTVLDFQYNYEDPNPARQHSLVRKVYVGSRNGLLFQINYETKELEEVYKLHENAAITSIALGNGFCITGGADQLLRVWKMDFAEYILEAGNDGVVTSLVLSADALQVACGTSTGALSILDLVSNNYKTIIRSHTEPVTQIAYHSFSNSMITLGKDLTIRLWDPVKLEQTYQFSYPGEDPCLCLAANPHGLYFAAGFASGVLRIFDIENTCVIDEIKHHDHAIRYIEYSLDGRFLAVLEQKMSMLYSPLHGHQPVKHLPTETDSKYKHCSFKEDSDVLAVIGDNGTHVNLWHLKSLTLLGKIFAGKVLKKLKFQEEGLWTIFQDTSIRRYNINKMTCEVEMQALHRNTLSAIAFEMPNHLLFTAGGDSFVRVWDYSFLRDSHQFSNGHVKDIHDICYANGQLWTVGSEGVFVWDFNQHIDKFIPPPIFAKEKKATFIKGNKENSRNMGNSLVHSNSQSEQLSNIECVEEPREVPEPKIVFSNLLKKTADNEGSNKFVPTRLEMTFAAKLTPYKRYKKKEGKPLLTLQLPVHSVQLSLPLKHPSQEETAQLEYPKKIDAMKVFSKKYKLEFLMGLDPHIHDNVVWNFMYGWYAYIYDNLVIVESLNKVRSQRIITLPQKLCSLSLTKDFKRLIVSSQFNSKKKVRNEAGEEEESDVEEGVADSDDKSSAAIFILGLDFSIERKLQFHPKGVQGFRLSENGKFLISIGNFRQCTVCVWDFLTGKLKSSSYTLDKLNDLAVSPRTGEGKLLQFVTVGRDQVHFWSYLKDETLQYLDLFIKPEEEEYLELTACDYLPYHEDLYLMMGTTKGELLIVSTLDHSVTFRRKICSGEITIIKNYPNRAVIGSSDGCLYCWVQSSSILQSIPTPSFNKINLTYSVTGLHLDQSGGEGVVGTSEAVYYVNITESFSSLLVGSTPSEVLLMRLVQGYLLTSHANGRLKLWNVETGEQLKTYKWRYPCTEVYYDDTLAKMVCFCSNQAVKLVNLKKFTKEEVYLPEDAKVDRDDEYVVYTCLVNFMNRSARWVFTRKGCAYSFDISQEGKKKGVKTEKTLQLNLTVGQIHVNPEKNLIVASSTSGIVTVFNIDCLEKYSLLVVDRTTLEDFNHEKIDRRDEGIPRERIVRLALSKVLNETYLCVAQDSQYLYFRNYMKRITFQKISMSGFPRSLSLSETKKDSEVVIGLKEGGILRINAVDCDQRVRYQGIVNHPVTKLLSIKTKSWIALAHTDALALYSIDI